MVGTRGCARTRPWASGSTSSTPGAEMGFFKDVSKLKKQAKEIDKTWDPGAEAQAAVEKMKAVNEQMARSTAAMTAPPGDAVEASAQVVSVGPTVGSMNLDPMLPVEFLVMED